MSQDNQIWWLKLAAAIVIGFGIVLGAAAVPGLSGPTALMADLVFWPLDGQPTLESPLVKLLCAITGGVMVGWGILLWHVAGVILAQNASLGRNIMLTSISAWFAIDTLGSLLAGAYVNALGNVGFLLLFVVPLMCGPKEAPTSD